MSHFLIVAYKPDSVDYCRGCRMESYSADHAVTNMLTADALVDLWAVYLLKNLNLGCNESGYGFWIFKDGIKVFDEYQPYWDGVERGYDEAWYESVTYEQLAAQQQQDNAEIVALYEKALALAESMNKNAQDLAAAKAQADKEQAEAAAREKRRQEFLKLNQEFGPA